MQAFFQRDPEPQHRRPIIEEPSINTRDAERDTETLVSLSHRRCSDKIAKLPSLRDVNTDLYITNPQMTVEIDREKAAVYGITVDQIRSSSTTPMARVRSRTIYTPSNDYQIIVEDAAGNSRSTRYAICPKLCGEDRAAARLIPPDQLWQPCVPTVGPLQVNHQGQQPCGDDLVQPRAGASLGQAIDAIQRDRARIRICRPRSPPASRAPRRCSRIRCKGRAS